MSDDQVILGVVMVRVGGTPVVIRYFQFYLF